MPTWDSLASNELVDLDAIANAVSLGYFAFQSGQSTSGGTRCVTVSDAETLLQLNTSYLPTDGSMPVKADFVGASSTVRITMSEQVSPVFVDGNVLVYEPGIATIVEQYFSPYDETFTINGGTPVHVQVYAVEATSAIGPLKTLQVTENGVLIYWLSNPQFGSYIEWEKYILPNSTYLIAVTTSSYTGSYSYYNASGLDIFWYIGDEFSPLAAGYLYNGNSLDILSIMTTYPSYNFTFAVPEYYSGSNNYTIIRSPSGTAETQFGLAPGEWIQTLALSDVSDFISNGDYSATITLDWP